MTADQASFCTSQFCQWITIECREGVRVTSQLSQSIHHRNFKRSTEILFLTIPRKQKMNGLETKRRRSRGNCSRWAGTRKISIHFFFFFFQKWINIIGALFDYCKGKRFDAVNLHRQIHSRSTNGADGKIFIKIADRKILFKKFTLHFLTRRIE